MAPYNIWNLLQNAYGLNPYGPPPTVNPTTFSHHDLPPRPQVVHESHPPKEEASTGDKIQCIIYMVVYLKYVFGVPHLATYTFFLYFNEPGLGTLFDLAWL